MRKTAQLFSVKPQDLKRWSVPHQANLWNLCLFDSQLLKVRGFILSVSEHFFFVEAGPVKLFSSTLT